MRTCHWILQEESDIWMDDVVDIYFEDNEDAGWEKKDKRGG